MVVFHRSIIKPYIIIILRWIHTVTFVCPSTGRAWSCPPPPSSILMTKHLVVLSVFFFLFMNFFTQWSRVLFGPNASSSLVYAILRVHNMHYCILAIRIMWFEFRSDLVNFYGWKARERSFQKALLSEHVFIFQCELEINVTRIFV